MRIDSIKSIILKTKEKNKIQNSYIIYGGDRKKREEIALFLSGILNCENGIFCEKCESCEKIKNNTHPDIRWIFPEKSILSIDEVKTVKEDIFIKPYYNKYKIYIFQVEYIKEEAASSFLKIIEEPPFYGIIIIICPNINFLLPTIISRCSKIYLNYTLPEYKEEFEKYKEEFVEFIKLTEDKKFSDFFKKIDLFCKNRKREEIETWIESILFYIRDSFFYNLSFSKEFLINKNFEKKIDISIDINLMEKLWEVKQRIKYNINTKLAIENLIFQIILANDKL
ncbi:MAG: hypothetical protein NC833_04370 [Candidatus Omnitrophica bacterium]|nr:hypothetical protein [Candidatus Omnitrophota bacterium]